MSTPLSETKTKELIAEVLTDMIRDRRGEFYEVVPEALEDVGLADAIREGAETDFVDERDVLETLTR